MNLEYIVKLKCLTKNGSPYGDAVFLLPMSLSRVEYRRSVWQYITHPHIPKKHTHRTPVITRLIESDNP